MDIVNRDFPATDQDGLRLIALGRIPRCTVCPRYAALVRAHAAAAGAVDPLPPAPRNCTHQVCAPLARRLGPPARSEYRLAVAGG